MVTGFGWWRLSSMRNGSAARVIRPPIGFTSALLKGAAVRIVIINYVFPEQKYSYVNYTRTTVEDSALPKSWRTHQLLARNQRLGRADGLGSERLGRQQPGEHGTLGRGSPGRRSRTPTPNPGESRPVQGG